MTSTRSTWRGRPKSPHGRFPAVAAVVFMLVVAGTASGQCAMCRTALDSPEGQQLIAAFQGGILLLVSVPFVALATIALLVTRKLRAAARLEASAEA